MPIRTISHLTTYRYARPVAFGEHSMMLRPRDDADQKVLDARIDISPAPAELTWSLDRYGNHVARASFARRATELRIESIVRVDHSPCGLHEADIEDDARDFPFSYSPAYRGHLAPFLIHADDPTVQRWVLEFLDRDGLAWTRELLEGLTRSIRASFRHRARHEPGIQPPSETLNLRSGSCRDFAVLMIEGLRSLGIAARFVSGYLHVRDQREEEAHAGNTHAWVQAYLPGAGWIDLDPSSGIVGNLRHVRVAAVADPCEAIPLYGSYAGAASDFSGMRVSVKVTCEDDQDEAEALRLRA